MFTGAISVIYKLNAFFFSSIRIFYYYQKQFWKIKESSPCFAPGISITMPHRKFQIIYLPIW